MAPPGVLNVGLIGLGTVGSQVAARLIERRDALARRSGGELNLCRILVRDPAKPRALEVPPGLITADPDLLLDDPAINVVVEVAGGDEPVRTFLERAIKSGKHVVTANKLVMARHGPSLLELAGEMNVDIHFEAAVGGGIPLISTFRTDLQANDIERIGAIINGTTNYVLGRMATDGIDFQAALAEAQAAGFAEADPTDDIDGHDATYKLAIMASIGFGARVAPEEIYREGIAGIQQVDFRYARELGYEIKLVAIGSRLDGRVEVRVHPALVPGGHPLAQVQGAYNAVFIEGDLVGQVLLVGEGAGGRPTASAVVGDLIDLARSIRRGVQLRSAFSFDPEVTLVPMDDVISRAYFRIRVADRPGVIAAIGTVFAEEQVSISSLIQKDQWVADGTAELVVTTHPASNGALERSRLRMGDLDTVRSVPAFIRIFE
jgi:homoserine dehydrogenase